VIGCSRLAVSRRSAEFRRRYALPHSSSIKPTVGRLFLKMPVRLGPIAEERPKARMSGGKPPSICQRVGESPPRPFHLPLSQPTRLMLRTAR